MVVLEADVNLEMDDVVLCFPAENLMRLKRLYLRLM